MRSTFKILYYINRCKVKADGTTAIMCRITIDGKNSVFATGCYCNPKDWKAKTGEVRDCLLYTSPSPRDRSLSRMPSSA